MFPPKKKPTQMDPEDPSTTELDEIMKFARGEMSRDMAKRHGKPLPMDEEDALDGGADEATEDPTIPGVEASEEPVEGGEGDPDAEAPVDGELEAAGDAKRDPQKLRKILAAMKMKQTG